MTERIGTCTGCGAHYGNIPPTVTATKVRCRKCGGTVEIPPLAAPAPDSLQARPLGASRPKGNGERPASAAPVDRGVARPAAAPPPAAPKDPAKSAAVLANLKAKKQSATPPAALRPPAPPAPLRPPARKPAGRKGTPHGHGEGGSEGHHAHHAHPHVKQGPPVALTLVAVVALAAVGFGLWWLSQQGDEAPVTPELGAAAPAAPATTTLQPAAADPAAAAAPPPPTAIESTPPAASGEEGAAAPPKPAAPVHVEPAWAPPEPGGTIPSVGYLDPDSIRLGEVPLLPKWSGTPEEDWTVLVADLELFLADEGRSSTLAGNRLVAAGRGAFPVLVNGMLRTNWSDLDSISLSHSLNNKISEIGKGSNFGWKDVHLYEPDSAEWRDAVLFDKKIIATWYNLWVTKLSVDDAQWTGFTKSAAEKKAEADGAAGGARDLAPPSRPVIDD